MHVPPPARGALLLVLLGLPLVHAARPRPRPTPTGGAPLAISDVTLVDGTGAPARRGVTVLVDEGRIAAITSGAEARLPPGTRRIDGSRRFLIPGLWDAHVHTLWPGLPEENFGLFLASGVTGVRDMHATLTPSEIAALRRAVAAGATPGPRLVAAGPLVDGPSPAWQGALLARTPEEARAAVQRLAADGADFVKAHESLEPSAYRALVAAARERGLPVAGHVPVALTPEEVAEAGQRTIEHLDALLLAASSEEPELRRRYQALVARGGSEGSAAEFATLLARMEETLDTGRLQRLAAALAAKGTCVTPTLVVTHLQGRDLVWASTWVPMRYILRERRERWMKRMPEQAGERQRRADARVYAGAHGVVVALHKAGVRLLAGTDVGTPLVVPGFSLQQELELLAAAGLSPLEVLQSATRTTAECLGRLDRAGTIAVGKEADLVLLDADPLADARNLRRVHAVVAGGRLWPREKLDELLAAAAERAAALTLPPPSPSPLPSPSPSSP